MTRFKLISFKLCPYVQRVAIVLAEKGVAFERIDIDLADKPDWFLALSPLGKVPVLVVAHDGEEQVLFESAVIAEYLDETLAPPLHPADPLEKARHRAWIEFASTLLADFYGFYTGDAAVFADKRGAIDAKLDQLEAEIGGPYFAGERFALVDAAFAPALRYLATFERFLGEDLLRGRPKLAQWRASLAERPSIAGAVAPDYPEALAAFIASKNGHMARAAQAPAQAA